MPSFFACMPSVDWLPCAFQPYSPIWFVIGYGALIILGIAIAIGATVIIKKQQKKVKKG